MPLFLTSLSLLGAGALEVGPSPEAVALRQLWSEHSRQTKAPGSLWGVHVQDLNSGRVLFETNSTQRMIPASTMKLYTVALALRHWGADHRFTTTLRTTGTRGADGVLRGDLVLVGGDTPGFGDRTTTRLETAFQPVLDALNQAGIRRLDGGLRLVFPGWTAAPYGSGWGWDDLQEGYGAAVSPFVAMENAVWISVHPGASVGDPARIESRFLPLQNLFDLQSSLITSARGSRSQIRFLRLPGSNRLSAQGTLALGSVHQERLSVPDPAVWFGQLLRQVLKNNGFINNDHELALTLDTDPKGAELGAPLAVVYSKPMAELAADCLKISNNLLAQWLLVRVGQDRLRQDMARAGTASGSNPPLGMDAEERGIAALQELLREWGVPREETEFEEGAGLSRKNLVTARATARVLQVMDQSALSDVWWSAFPVAGVDGTLRTRFLNSPAQGRVRAKTGTLRHVSALAGELHSNEGKRHWAFVVVANGFVDGTGQTSPVRELDTWVKALSEFAADPSAF